MIPRIKPSYTLAEWRAALCPPQDAVARVERALADYFAMKHALMFPYGRSALYACFRALDLHGEIVQPAYNCIVVAHATVLSGNRPVFVDCQRDDPNQDAEAMVRAINARTVAVIPTSIFGMSFDAPALVRAIRARNPQVLIVMDCAQCFDARWNGALIAQQGDVAILAFGIGKAMTMLFGGAVLTNHDGLYQRLADYRARAFASPSWGYTFLRLAYFVGGWLATTELGAFWFDVFERSALQASSLATLRARDSIRLPRDNTTQLPNLQAAIGLAQIARLGQFMARRREISQQYARWLKELPGIILPRWTDGSTHTIYTLRLEKPEWRPRVLAALRQRGVQAGTVLDYVVPAMNAYRELSNGSEFPNAHEWARRALNLPNHPTLSDAEVRRCADALRATFGAEG